MSKEDPFSFESIILEPLEEHQDEIDRLREKLRVEWSAADQQQARAETIEQEHDSLRARFTAPIVCMCGSSRYKQTWLSEGARLSGEGNIVLYMVLWDFHKRQDPDPAIKQQYDDLHKRKIDLCDWVWVLDVGGYIGSSTRSEIEYAEAHGKPVRYLSKEFPGYTEPVDPMDAACAAMREALEAVQDSPVITGKDTKAVWLQVSSATRKSISKALSLDAGKDLLERLEKAESIIKRTAQDRHRLIRNAACKQCKEFPCEGDDRVLCIHKNLMTDIDAYLKGGGKDA